MKTFGILILATLATQVASARVVHCENVDTGLVGYVANFNLDEQTQEGSVALSVTRLSGTPTNSQLACEPTHEAGIPEDAQPSWRCANGNTDIGFGVVLFEGGTNPTNMGPYATIESRSIAGSKVIARLSCFSPIRKR